MKYEHSIGCGARGTRFLMALCVIGSNAGCGSSDVDGVIVDVEGERSFGISWEDYRGSAIRGEEGFFVAEGDLMFPSERALRDHYDEMTSADESKLVVIQRLSDGFEPVLVGPEQMELTYCVANTFSNKSTVVSHMATATRAWEEVARLQFVYVSGQDASCSDSNPNVRFAVMPTTVGIISGCAANKEMWSGALSNWGCRTSVTQPYIKGVVLLNYASSLSAGQTWEGIVRHELGHLLGFRHEHPWDSPAVCAEDQTYTGATDMTGRQLTAYDVASVMHYQSCDGLAGTDFIISPLDGEGVRSIYGMPAAWYVRSSTHYDGYGGSMTLRGRRRLAGVLLLVPFELACSAPEERPQVDCRAAPIVGGSEQAEYVALASSQADAIVRLTIAGGPGTAEALCTAVIVAPGTALTALHCVPSEASSLSLHFDSDAGGTAVVSLSVEHHSSLDLALLTWDGEDTLLDAIQPIPVDLDYPSQVGDLIQIAGFGLTEQGELGILRFATERIVESDAESFRVSAGHRAGACYGDSGGPALSRASDGSARVVGILSVGASGCADTDRYTRLNGLGTWLGAHGVVPGPALELADCQFVGRAGRCFADSVLSCPDGVSPRVDRCQSGTRCGFDASAGGFGCVSPSRDTCEGVGDLGSCDEDNLLRCVKGSVVSAPCAACGATCQASVRDGRAICTW